MEEALCVVGMALRVPGAASPDVFWDNLINARESITHFSEAQLLAEGVSREVLSQPNYVKACGIIPDFKEFSPEFFGISEREAQLIDPQQRIALECAWEALEHAGYDPYRYTGRIGVYAGAGFGHYHQYVHSRLDELDATQRFTAHLGQVNDYLPLRISYKLNLRGPSICVQTACSTSLVSLHLACQSLRAGESDMCLAGGVSVEPLRMEGYLHSEGGIVSPDGRCRAFDEHANGTVFSNGAAFVLVKRLSDAVRDGDTIHAVIKASAVNNDGNVKVGFFAPSIDGQSAVVAQALVAAGLGAENISYVEAHGTGTMLGDHIEIEALSYAFRATTSRRQYCAIGSVKPNVGHLNAAAGIASIIKTCLALRHRQIPPSLNCTAPSSRIAFEATPFYVNTALRPWESDGIARTAGVTSLGVGGTNAHVILQEAPAAAPRPRVSQSHHLLLLSAKSESSLMRLTEQYAALLEKDRHDARDVAHTLQIGRAHFRYRLACTLPATAKDHGNLLRKCALVKSSERVSHVLVIPGSAPMSPECVRQLRMNEPAFARELDECFDVLPEHMGKAARAALDAAAPSEGNLSNDLARHDLARLCALYALSRVLFRWGLKPNALLGYGLGEYVVAALADVMSFECAASLVWARGTEIEQLAAGALLEFPPSEVDLLSEEPVSTLYVNQHAIGIVGSTDSIERLVTELERRQSPYRRPRGGRDLRKPNLERVAITLKEMAAAYTFGQPSIPVISSATSQWWGEEVAVTPEYWAHHTASHIRLSKVVQALRHRLEDAEFIALGESEWFHGAEGVTSNVGGGKGVLDLSSPSSLGATCYQHFLDLWGAVWASGAQLDWTAFVDGKGGLRIPLPTYPFEKRTVWFGGESPPPATIPSASSVTSAPRKTMQSPSLDKTQIHARGLRPASDTVGSSGDSSGGARLQATETHIVHVIKEVLRLERYSETDRFLDVGGNSLRAGEIARRIMHAYGVNLDLWVIFNSSPQELAAKINAVGQSVTDLPVLKTVAMRPGENSARVSTTTEASLTHLVGPFLPRGALTGSKNFLDSGGDSIAATQWMWAIEKEFGVCVDIEALLTTPFNDLVSLVEALQSTGKSPTDWASEQMSDDSSGRCLRQLREITARALGHDQVDTQVSLGKLITDAASLEEFMRRVEEELGVRFDVQAIMHQSIDELSKLIAIT